MRKTLKNNRFRKSRGGIPLTKIAGLAMAGLQMYRDVIKTDQGVHDSMALAVQNNEEAGQKLVQYAYTLVDNAVELMPQQWKDNMMTAINNANTESYSFLNMLDTGIDTLLTTALKHADGLEQGLASAQDLLKDTTRFAQEQHTKYKSRR